MTSAAPDPMPVREPWGRSLLATALLAFAAGLVPAAPSQSPDGGVATSTGGMTEAVAGADRDLEASLRALQDLRESIQKEKLPLLQELGRLEARLGDLRREYEATARRQDEAGLAAGNLAAVRQLRQDELAYIGNLLDEYSRGFESSLQVSERPRYETVLSAARLAPQDADLARGERLRRQVDLLRASLTRLEDLIGGARFNGQAVTPEGILVEGDFAIVGPVVLFAGMGGVPAGLALPQAGSPWAAVRPLEGEATTAGVERVVTTGEGILPLDPTRGGALQELIARGSLIGYFKKGGPIMYPLLFVSILAMTVLLERFVFLFVERRHKDPTARRAILSRVETGDIMGAIEAGRGSRDFIARALTYALQHREKSLSDALIRASGQELVRYTRGVSILDTIVTLAPLLGLLGTVTGMMSSFGMLGGAELSAPAQITGGIAEALIATAFGLGIAVTTLIPMNYLHTRGETARHDMEDACTHLELLMKPLLETEAYLLQERRQERASGAAAVQRALRPALATATGGRHEAASVSSQESEDRDRPSH